MWGNSGIIIVIGMKEIEISVIDTEQWHRRFIPTKTAEMDPQDYGRRSRGCQYQIHRTKKAEILVVVEVQDNGNGRGETG